MVIPKNLRDIAMNVDVKSNQICFDLSCRCGCDVFSVFKKEESLIEIEKIKKWEELLRKYNGRLFSDEHGNLFLQTKGFLGITRKKIQISQKDIPEHIDIIKVKCRKCGKEYIVFDSRKNGFDSFGKKKAEETDYGQVEFKEIVNVSQMNILLVYTETFTEFVEEYGEAFSEDDYADSFGIIEITKINGDISERIFVRDMT